ncbi:MAG: DegV family protein [Lachnospiraceae bacterium]|nr:DegV family protein [Lachnospiraceae bacterium]
MKINIIVDSGADYTAKEIEEYGLKVIPLKVSFGEETFLDGVDITIEEFFKRLKGSSVLPKTSQISPYDYETEFEKIKEAGEQAIVVTISSGLSGCFQSARIAAGKYKDMIRVVDSKSVSLGERIVVQRAMDLIAAGKDLSETESVLNEEIKKIKTIAALDTLTYLKKGGRLSTTAFLAGSLLALKPIVQVVDGRVEFVCTARGHRKVHSALNKVIEKAGQIDKNMPRSLAYSDTDRSILDNFVAALPELFANDIDAYQEAAIGPAIGTHIGPGAVAIAYFEK